MHDNNWREVRFDLYCPFCKYTDLPPHHDPCNECLVAGMNEETDRPVLWEEKE